MMIRKLFAGVQGKHEHSTALLCNQPAHDTVIILKQAISSESSGLAWIVIGAQTVTQGLARQLLGLTVCETEDALLKEPFISCC